MPFPSGIDNQAHKTKVQIERKKPRSRKSAFENNCLIPPSSKNSPTLKQPSLAFKIGRLYVHGAAVHLERQLHRDARCEPGFHCFQLVSLAAKSAEESSAGTGVTLMIHIAALACVEGRFSPSCGVTG